MQFRLIIFCFFVFLNLVISNVYSANRPYHDVLKEFVQKKCDQTKENIYLSQLERSKIEKSSGTKVYGGLALRYITKCPGNTQSFHYVDSHIVRTLNETVIVTIKDNKVESFIVSSFNEPPEYIAPKKWYAQFQGADGKEILRARAQVDALSGATLTVNASINVVNKILALHQLLEKKTNNSK